MVLSFDDDIHVADVDPVGVDSRVKTLLDIPDSRQTLIDFQNDNVRCLQDRFRCRNAEVQVEIPLVVHRRYAHHGYVDFAVAKLVEAALVPVHHRRVADEALVPVLSLIPCRVPAVVGEAFALRVLLHDLQRLEHEIASAVDVLDFALPLREGRVQQHRLPL